MNFKHYILTRFNLGLYSDNPHKIADPDEWMEHRMELFTRYCLPSVQLQTCQDFTWIIAFDGLTKGKYYQPCLLDNVIVCDEKPHEYLRKQPPQAEWLITSRFDNDDMYLPDFVEAVQREFKGRQEVIDIDYGVLDSKTGHQYTSNRLKANSMFLSLCEPWTGEVVTALGKPHSEMPNYYEARKIGLHAIQVIHDRNIMNKIIGTRI